MRIRTLSTRPWYAATASLPPGHAFSLQVKAYEDLFDRLVVDKVPLTLHIREQNSLTPDTMRQEMTQRYGLKGIARVLKSTQGEAM